jgi:hypothetical protein
MSKKEVSASQAGTVTLDNEISVHRQMETRKIIATY